MAEASLERFECDLSRSLGIVLSLSVERIDPPSATGKTATR
jgi:hypothetical protein